MQAGATKLPGSFVGGAGPGVGAGSTGKRASSGAHGAGGETENDARRPWPTQSHVVGAVPCRSTGYS